MVFVVASHYQKPSDYSFALTSMSFTKRFTSFVTYDRRLFKNCFQQRLIFYETPVFHHDFVKFLYCRVVCGDKRQ